jgi:hypothetical protein
MANQTNQAQTTQAAHQQALAAAGIDWTKLQGLNWQQLLQIIMSIIALFRQTPPAPPPVAGAAAGQAGAECDPTGCLKGHFEMIEALAVCGKNCCDSVPAP